MGDFASTGPVDQKFHVEGVTPNNRSFTHKTRLNDLLYGIKIWSNLLRHFVTNHAFDRRTDRQTDGQNSHR